MMQGSELKAIREGLGWGQRKFAEEIGMTQSYIGQMERGEKPIERRTELAALYLKITEGGAWTPVPMNIDYREVRLEESPHRTPRRHKGTYAPPEE